MSDLRAPEERADEFCREWGYSTERSAALAQLIRDTYEDAARIAEGRATEWLPGEESAEAAIRHGKRIAAAIRERANTPSRVGGSPPGIKGMRHD